MDEPSKAKRGSSIERAFHLVKALLAGQALDRHRAAEIMSVAHPAAAQYLKCAADILDLEVVEGPNRSSAYRMRKKHAPAVRDNEVVALALGAALAPVFRGSAHEAGMRAARDAAARGTRVPRKHLNRKFGFVPRGGELALPDRSGELDEIIDALLREETIRADYQHFHGALEPLVLHPLSLLVHEHQVYLVAYQNSLADVRPYRFARLSNVERGIGFAYPSPAEYDPELLFRDAFGIFLNYGGRVENVVVQLSARWSTHVNSHRWHLSQRVVPTPTGPRIEMKVRVCPELIAWVRSFGPDAQVVAPESLRRALHHSPEHNPGSG